MTRPILRQYEKQSTQKTFLSLNNDEKIRPEIKFNNEGELDRFLRKKRSKNYIQVLSKLDAGGHVNNQSEVDKIIDAIKNEFKDSDIAAMLLGIVAVCYLGEPYEVHSLDFRGEIIEHYEKGRKLPGKLEKVRNIALCGHYEFIEVYTDHCVAVSSDGAASIIKF